MRSLNTFTYVVGILIALSYHIPETYNGLCSVAVALLVLVTVPVAERVRIRKCQEEAQVARASGASEAHQLAERVALQVLTEARGYAAPAKERGTVQAHRASTD